MTPTEIVDMSRLIQEQLELAREANSGRSAITIMGDHTRDLRQTLIAIASGARLHDHDGPAEATLHVLLGEASLDIKDGNSVRVSAGGYLRIPAQRYGLEAITDCAMLLTVATRGDRVTQAR